MVVLDTNIYIYIANRTLPYDIIQGVTIAHASITRIESLGYQDITKGQEIALLEIFALSTECGLEEEVVKRAIGLRQIKKIGLGDAIIAATALENDCELWTANTKDFADIDGLKLHNPLDS